MFHIWESAVRKWRGRIVELDLDWKDGFAPIAITCTSLLNRLPASLTFKLAPEDAPLQDRLWSVSDYDLYSPAAIGLLLEFGAEFESVPAVIRGRTKNPVTNEYCFVHVMGCPKAVDWKLSDVDAGTDKFGLPYVKHARRLVLDQSVIPAEVSVFRLDEAPSLVLVSEAFRDAWNARGLTGARFEPLDQFRS